MARRNDTLLMTPAELAIRDAIVAVEKIGAHVLLTDAVVLLSHALTKVADYVDGTVALDLGQFPRVESAAARAARIQHEQDRSPAGGLTGG